MRARVALHSGRPTLTETGYVGLAVHATARFCYAAHGGQIIVSSAAAGVIRDALAEGVTLRSLGRWHFQGLPDAEELHQVDVAGLRGEHPPPRAAQAV